jgi:hypothetical protein
LELGIPRCRKNSSSPPAFHDDPRRVARRHGLESLLLLRGHRLDLAHPAGLILVELLDRREEGVLVLAQEKHRDSRIGREEQVGAEFPADLAALHIGVAKLGRALLLELGADVAAERAIFDELHRRVRIAHSEAAFGRLLDGLGPVAVGRRDLLESAVVGGGRLAVAAAVAAAGED